jgi:V8-like Glu-specific endopeptidase
MPQRPRLIQMSPLSKLFLGALAVVYVVYLGYFRPSLPFVGGPATITDHKLETDNNMVMRHWTVNAMRDAIDVSQRDDNAADFSQGSSDTDLSKATLQRGVLPRSGESLYPLSAVGKVFFTDASGVDYVCSGTAIVSSNRNTVDTAGHCLWSGSWVENVIFCPLYDNGNTPYGCWVARDLDVPTEWMNAKPNDLHSDFGMAIMAPNKQGDLTDVVGGVGWAYNQSARQLYSAYGYPAGYPFDGETRQSCENAAGTPWKQGAGTVVSIPCNMTGGSSGGPWFIQVDGNWYLNGHNDFTSSMRPGHMFSPYYGDTWYALYQNAQDA